LLAFSELLKGPIAAKVALLKNVLLDEAEGNSLQVCCGGGVGSDQLGKLLVSLYKF
jgi:hypothetical protein